MVGNAVLPKEGVVSQEQHTIVTRFLVERFDFYPFLEFGCQSTCVYPPSYSCGKERMLTKRPEIEPASTLDMQLLVKRKNATRFAVFAASKFVRI